jgi:hypothetical protein
MNCAKIIVQKEAAINPFGGHCISGDFERETLVKH